MRSVPQRPVVLLSYFTLRDLGNLLDAVRRSGIAKQADVYIGSYGANPRTANAVHEEGTRYLSARREASLREFAVFNFRFDNASPQDDERCSAGCLRGFPRCDRFDPSNGGRGIACHRAYQVDRPKAWRPGLDHADRSSQTSPARQL